MISENELLCEIEKLKDAPPTFTSIQKLASLYTVYEYLYGNPKPDYNGRNAERMTSGETDFLKVVSRTDQNKVWDVLDELMSVLKVSHTRLYDGVMKKLEE